MQYAPDISRSAGLINNWMFTIRSVWWVSSASCHVSFMATASGQQVCAAPRQAAGGRPPADLIRVHSFIHSTCVVATVWVTSYGRTAVNVQFTFCKLHRTLVDQRNWNLSACTLCSTLWIRWRSPALFWNSRSGRVTNVTFPTGKNETSRNCASGVLSPLGLTGSWAAMMSVSVLEPDGLRELMESTGSDRRRLLVVDCRPFTLFNSSHVDGAVNVYCPPIVRRRAGGVIPVVNVVRSAEALADLTSGRCRAVVVYDERSSSVDELDADSNACLSLGSLATVLTSSTPLCLLKGIAVDVYWCLVRKSGYLFRKGVLTPQPP